MQHIVLKNLKGKITCCNSDMQPGIFKARDLTDIKVHTKQFQKRMYLEIFFSDLETKETYEKFQNFVSFKCNKIIAGLLSRNVINSFKNLREKRHFTFLRTRAGVKTARSTPQLGAFYLTATVHYVRPILAS